MAAEQFGNGDNMTGMAESTHHQKLKPGSARNFGLVFASAFAVIGLWPLLYGDGPRLWFSVAAVAFFVAALAIPKALAPLNLLWFRFGLLLGRIVSPIIMSLVFALAVVPTGLILRLLGKDILDLKIDPDRDTYWERRTSAPGSMTNQY